MGLSLADKTTPKSNVCNELRTIEVPILGTVAEKSLFSRLRAYANRFFEFPNWLAHAESVNACNRLFTVAIS